MSSSIMSVLAPSLNSFKIQTRTMWGWADLKTSDNGEDYEVETFDSMEDAQNEMNDMIESLNEDADLYRVVDSNTEEEVDLYY
jgi:hypothetical protein